MKSTRQRKPVLAEDGIGLIEVVVAMTLVILIALAFVPVVTQSYSSVQRNDDLVEATQVLSSQMESLRTKSTWTCSELAATSTVTTAVGGVNYYSTRTRGATCPETTGSAIGTVVVCVYVTKTAPTSTVANCPSVNGVPTPILATATTRLGAS